MRNTHLAEVKHCTSYSTKSHSYPQNTLFVDKMSTFIKKFIQSKSQNTCVTD